MGTTQQISEIGEELRITRQKSDGKRAFEYVFNKHSEVFDGNYSMFLICMKICATFWCSRGEQVEADRENTEYIYI